MTIQTFPIEVKIAYPVKVKENWRTLIAESEGGVEQRASKWTRPIREIEFNCELMEQSTEADALSNFFRARKGTAEAFMFVFPYKRAYLGEIVAVADGTIRTWRLPFTGVSFYTVYVNGVEKFQGPDYDLLLGIAPGGSDVIVFRDVPTVGQLVTVDASDATFVPYVRLAEAFEDEYTYFGRYYARVRLIEVKDEVSIY